MSWLAPSPRASDHVDRVLANAAESRRELEAMIDSMQDAVVAVDKAGRIQWTNQHMQQFISGVSVTGVVRVGHALVQTIRDPEMLECVRIVLEERTVCVRRSTSLLPGRIFEVNVSPMPGGGAVAVLHDITRDRTGRAHPAGLRRQRLPRAPHSAHLHLRLRRNTARSRGITQPHRPRVPHHHPQECLPHEPPHRGSPRHGAGRILRAGASPRRDIQQSCWSATPSRP